MQYKKSDSYDRQLLKNINVFKKTFVLTDEEILRAWYLLYLTHIYKK